MYSKAQLKVKRIMEKTDDEILTLDPVGPSNFNIG